MSFGFARYFRMLWALARFGLAGEMSFRANFLVKITVEVLWLTILLTLYDVIYYQTKEVAGWSENEYRFFLGCFFAMEGLIESLFLENCTEFADLVRTGDLDFLLLKPIDEQFLVTCRKIDWSTMPNVLMGAGVMGVALYQKGWQFNLLELLLFFVLLACGLCIAYSCLLILMSTSVWLIRNQNLMEMWWLFTSLMRYPKEIFRNTWAAPIGLFFTFAVPILLVINVPASVMVRQLEPGLLACTIGGALVFFLASRQFFRYALRRYRSASS